MVGVERFELPTSWSQTRRATRLRYTPEGGYYTFPPMKGQFEALPRIRPDSLSSDNDFPDWNFRGNAEGTRYSSNGFLRLYSAR